jgi:hypothetical protein
MKNLAEAIVAVMSEVKGMEKNSKVGKGNSAYNGTKDSDVKEIFNDALVRNGLCILPIGIEESTQIDRWDQEEVWNGVTSIKQKQSVFTKVTTKYLLLHTSGESQVLAGYGHGVDPQDKGAGKATTYALKNCLLYAFLTPVGKIDDTEATHSNDHQLPKQAPTLVANKPKLPDTTFQNNVIVSKDIKALESSISYYDLTEDQRNQITIRIDNLKKGVE